MVDSVSCFAIASEGIVPTGNVSPVDGAVNKERTDGKAHLAPMTVKYVTANAIDMPRGDEMSVFLVDVDDALSS
jgi:hypothetical protein